MHPFSFIQPIVPSSDWKQKRPPCISSDGLQVVSAGPPRYLCQFKIDNAISQTSIPTSRRSFGFQVLAILASTAAPQVCDAATPRRTILDEERELREEMRKKDEEDRRNALREAFEAVAKASEQLDDVTKFLDEGDWKGIRRFTRLFNNAVEREGMEPLTRKLSTKGKQEDSFQICKHLTETLKDMDQSAKREDSQAVLADLDKARQVLAAFQEFKP